MHGSNHKALTSYLGFSTHSIFFSREETIRYKSILRYESSATALRRCSFFRSWFKLSWFKLSWFKLSWIQLSWIKLKILRRKIFVFFLNFFQKKFFTHQASRKAKRTDFNFFNFFSFFSFFNFFSPMWDFA